MNRERFEDSADYGRTKFRIVPIGTEITIPITALLPSQPDDGLPPKSHGPVEAAIVDGIPMVVHGNHRFYRRMDLLQPHSVPNIRVKKVPNPYA